MECLGEQCPRDFVYMAKCMPCADRKNSLFRECRYCKQISLEILKGFPAFDLHIKYSVVSYHFHDYSQAFALKVKLIKELEEELGIVKS